MNETVRRDALPLWVTCLLALFLILRIIDVATLPNGKAAQKAAVVNDAAMQDLIETDLMAKMAYTESIVRPGPHAPVDITRLRQALASANSFQTETNNSPDAASHVILLRALLKAYDPPAVAAKDLTPLAVGPNHLAPLNAFTTSLPRQTPSVDRAAFAAEGMLWKTVFGKTTLSAAAAQAAAAQISHLPEIRWWRWPALSVLYQRAGNAHLTARYAQAASAHAAMPLLGLGFLSLARIALGLAGIGILVYFLSRTLASRKTSEVKSVGLWPTVPERQPYSERRLGAGDLMAVFVVYLVARQVIQLIFSGFHGFGGGHWLAVPGVIAPFIGTIRRMSAVRRDSLEVVLEAATYLLAAVPPLVYLGMMAHRRGASLGRELGWSTRSLWPNVGYGIAGYAVATPLILVVGLLAPALFRHAPAPSNPVIPEMVNTSGFWTTALLIALASVAAPLVEELLFRGVFYNAAKLRLGPWPAIVLTGLVFGFLHPVGIAEMLMIATLGGVFAWMAETRKSLVPSITAHCLNNLMSTLILLLALAK